MFLAAFALANHIDVSPVYISYKNTGKHIGSFNTVFRHG